MLRIGTLGAARITAAALLRPARALPGVEVVAVAARDQDRARAFANKHGIPTVAANYEALIADPGIDAVYNPLPNGLHGAWTLAALAAGKHVLCEKPFTANAAEAAMVADAAESSGLTVMEAFHWRYHPLAQRMLDVLAGGELGAVRHIDAWVCFPLLRPSDIRWDLALAGGAMMDAGCYGVHLIRTLAGAEPAVSSARALLASPGVDRLMQADLRFDDGRTATVTASMRSRHLLRVGARVTGDHGRLDVINPLAPHLWNRLTVRSGGRRRGQRVRGGATYSYQLQAFASAVAEGTPVLTSARQAVANMAVIDEIYRAAGLEPRLPTPR